MLQDRLGATCCVAFLNLLIFAVLLVRAQSRSWTFFPLQKLAATYPTAAFRTCRPSPLPTN